MSLAGEKYFIGVTTYSDVFHAYSMCTRHIQPETQL